MASASAAAEAAAAAMGEFADGGGGFTADGGGGGGRHAGLCRAQSAAWQARAQYHARLQRTHRRRGVAGACPHAWQAVASGATADGSGIKREEYYWKEAGGHSKRLSGAFDCSNTIV